MIEQRLEYFHDQKSYPNLQIDRVQAEWSKKGQEVCEGIYDLYVDPEDPIPDGLEIDSWSMVSGRVVFHTFDSDTFDRGPDFIPNRVVFNLEGERLALVFNLKPNA